MLTYYKVKSRVLTARKAKFETTDYGAACRRANELRAEGDDSAKVLQMQRADA